MGSLYEELALGIFSLKTNVELIRKDMKKTILDTIDPLKKYRNDGGAIEEISKMKRTPDAIAILTPEHAESLGLEKRKTILFCEAEHSNPITKAGLIEYADIYDSLCNSYNFNAAVVIIEKYGRYQFLELGYIYVALLATFRKAKNRNSLR